MDLGSSKVSDQDKLDLCRKYFCMGFALLPFLWGINAVWFFREAFVRPPFPEQKTIKCLVLSSAVGATAFLVGVVAWFVTYLTHRAEWGATGDAISFNIPTGSP